MARCAGVLKKLVLFETKDNVGLFSTCLGHGNEPCQKEIRNLLGELAAFFMRLTVNLHISYTISNRVDIEPIRYRLNKFDIDLFNSISIIII
jgi:hypothetical protein